MAIKADRAREYQAMFGGGIVVNLVTTDAGDIAAMQDYVARVAQDMAVSRIQIAVIRPGEIDLEIREQIVTRLEVIGVRKAVRFSFALAQVALPADRFNLPGVLGMLFGEPDQGYIVRMILGRHAVARIAVERGGGEGVRTRVHRGGVTARATHLERLFVPGLAIN